MCALAIVIVFIVDQTCRSYPAESINGSSYPAGSSTTSSKSCRDVSAETICILVV